MHIEHKAGDKMFVDYAGDKLAATTGIEWTPLANLDGPTRKLSSVDLSVRITPI
jgi:hypothetical protein